MRLEERLVCGLCYFDYRLRRPGHPLIAVRCQIATKREIRIDSQYPSAPVGGAPWADDECLHLVRAFTL